MDKVFLTGKLTSDPEMRSLANGQCVTKFVVTTEEYAGNGQVKETYHEIIAWDKLATICAEYLGKGSKVAVEGKLQTRQWDDGAGKRHWKIEINATVVELMSGRHAIAQRVAGSDDAIAKPPPWWVDEHERENNRI